MDKHWNKCLEKVDKNKHKEILVEVIKINQQPINKILKITSPHIDKKVFPLIHNTSNNSLYKLNK